MKKRTVIFVAVWLICGIFNTGMVYAHLPYTFPSVAGYHRTEDAWIALEIGVMGPIGTIAEVSHEITTTGTFLKYGWRLPPLSAFK